MKKLTALSLAVILLLSMSLPSFAATNSTPKEEVIYGQLNADGSLKRVDVVNSFAGGNITDYGDYLELKNLTSQETLSQTNDLIQVTTTADRFFYQGQLKNPQLPWNFQLVYTLNGKEISAEELAGKSGRLVISLKVSQNKSVKIGRAHV